MSELAGQSYELEAPFYPVSTYDQYYDAYHALSLDRAVTLSRVAGLGDWRNKHADMTGFGKVEAGLRDEFSKPIPRPAVQAFRDVVSPGPAIALPKGDWMLGVSPGAGIRLAENRPHAPTDTVDAGIALAYGVPLPQYGDARATVALPVRIAGASYSRGELDLSQLQLDIGEGVIFGDNISRTMSEQASQELWTVAQRMVGLTLDMPRAELPPVIPGGRNRLNLQPRARKRITITNKISL